ncbi:MAG: TauD/TfdA family dioxygenase [Rhizorhabdus sp.]
MGTEFIERIQARQRPEQYLPLSITPLMPNFAARVEGIDLSVEQPEEVRVALREAWLTFGVLFFTGQTKAFTPDEQLRVASIFGVPDNGSPMVEKATTQVDVITTDADRPPVTNLWHSDNTSMPVPSLGTLIQIQKCPPVGGNTAWACTRKAYNCLSEGMKQYLSDKIAVHYWDGRGRSQPVYLQNFNQDVYFEKLAKYPPKENPVVMTHPITGEKSIYVNETYTNYIQDMHKYESKAILEFLYSWMRMPEFFISHHWTENDVAVWDNFSMQHYGLADYAEYRVNQRVTFNPYP